ncbi:hypothetical protein F4824DRAFT_105662 [Ustulina deusta]|nr:hypothetical protein F4824DRAFT_105662 [Ustulina deusta]
MGKGKGKTTFFVSAGERRDVLMIRCVTGLEFDGAGGGVQGVRVEGAFVFFSVVLLAACLFAWLGCRDRTATWDEYCEHHSAVAIGPNMKKERKKLKPSLDDRCVSRLNMLLYFIFRLMVFMPGN